MVEKVLRFFAIFTLIYAQVSSKHHRQKFSLLRAFTCKVAKDVIRKNPETRTIALIELENKFPHSFSSDILKCLPDDVTKLIIQPHSHIFMNNTISVSKSSIVIYVADKVEKVFK